MQSTPVLFQRIIAIASISTLLEIAACSKEEVIGTTQVVSYTQARSNPDLYAPGYIPTDIVFSPNGQYIATTLDDYVVVWNIPENIEAMRQDVDSRNGVGVVFSPDEKRLAIFNSGAVSVLDIQEGTELTRLVEPRPVSGIAFSNNGESLLSYLMAHTLGTGERLLTLAPGFVKLWNSQTGEELATIPSEYPYSVAASADGDSVVIGNMDRTVSLWDSRSRTELKQIDLGYESEERADNLAVNVGFASGSPHIWAVTRGAVLSWNTESGEEVLRVDDTRLIPGVSPNGQLVATLHKPDDFALPNRISVWSTQNGQELMQIEEDEDCKYTNDFSFSAGNKYLATICSGGTTGDASRYAIFDLQSGERKLTSFSKPEVTDGWSLSPSGQQIAIRYANEDETETTTEVWNIQIE